MVQADSEDLAQAYDQGAVCNVGEILLVRCWVSVRERQGERARGDLVYVVNVSSHLITILSYAASGQVTFLMNVTRLERERLRALRFSHGAALHNAVRMSHDVPTALVVYDGVFCEHSLDTAQFGPICPPLCVLFDAIRKSWPQPRSR